jgi:glucan 1,6-alpha-glucosidase
MTNIKLDIGQYVDVEIRNLYKDRIAKGFSHEAVMDAIYARGRDNARTPMQWSDGKNAGFTTGTPWLPVNPNYLKINAEAALQDPNSIFYYYQRLIQLRKSYSVFRDGDFELLYPDHTELFAYTRENKEGKMLVVCNFSPWHTVFRLPDEFLGSQVLIANYPQGESNLRPYEAFILYQKKGS